MLFRSRQLGLVTTGHASRGTSGPPGPSATNLYIAAGKMKPDELMADIKSGFYVTSLMGHGINMVTGDYSRGAAGFWIENGKIAHPVSEVTVAGNLTTFYNSMQTGVFDGVITFDTAISAYKFHEVAPYINKVGFGAMHASGLTVNERRWKAFPEAIRKAFVEVAAAYEVKAAEYYRDAGEKSIQQAVAQGAKIVPFTAEERAKLAALLPNFALEWARTADAKGLPGTQTLKAYMEISRAEGVAHARAWDKE